MSMTPEEARILRNAKAKEKWHATKAEREAKWEKIKPEREQSAARFALSYNCFPHQNGSSYESWRKSVGVSRKTFNQIANLQPDPGQTLAELIHELSGYAMEVCEQIANPTVIEDSLALTPPAAPDLF